VSPAGPMAMTVTPHGSRARAASSSASAGGVGYGRDARQYFQHAHEMGLPFAQVHLDEALVRGERVTSVAE